MKDDLERRLAKFLARQHYMFSWSKMTIGERNDSVQFEMWQPDFKPLLNFIKEEIENVKEN
jgi:hypothetical protein